MATEKAKIVIESASFGGELLGNPESSGAFIELVNRLQWSDPPLTDAWTSRMLLEHLMMTTIAKALRSTPIRGPIPYEQRLMQSVDQLLAIVERGSGVVLERRKELVRLYVRSVLGGGMPRKRVSTVGIDCLWLLGCPTTGGDGIVPEAPESLAKFIALEADHIFPLSLQTRETESSEGQTLCQYHNRSWKANHLCFALRDDLMVTRRTGP